MYPAPNPICVLVLRHPLAIILKFEIVRLVARLQVPGGIGLK
jgi:hypothetical protein